VLDLYQFYLLSQLKQFSKGLPPHKGDHVRVFYPGNQAEALVQSGNKSFLFKDAKSRKISREEICASADKMVIRLSMGEMKRLADMTKDVGQSAFIYSMWQGYLERDPRMEGFPKIYGCDWTSIHTSGHAWREDLQKLTQKIAPDMLVPIHTLQGNDFSKYFDNVVRIQDGEGLIMGDQYKIAKDFKRGFTNSKAIEETKSFLETRVGKRLCDLIQGGIVIACIRDNYIDFYVSGCAILTYKPLASTNMFRIHKKYLPKEYQKECESKSSYICLKQGNNTDLILPQAKGFSFFEHILYEFNPELKAYIEASNQKSFSEKHGIHSYINAPEQWENKVLIDLEIAFSLSINGKRPCAKRVDLAWLEEAEDGEVILRMVEVKVDTDNRLRSSNENPEVLKQMQQYEFFLGKQTDNIIESYRTIAENFCVDFPGLRPPGRSKLMEKFKSQEKHTLFDMPSLLVLITFPVKNRWEHHYEILKRECENKSWTLDEVAVN